jgi:TRAP-type C4-dicarboxylate transport system permease small subunit
MSAFRKFNGKIGFVEQYLALFLMCVIVILVFVSAVLRTVGFPVVWSIDLAQLLFIWICVFGADAALKAKAHIGVDLLVRQFPAKLQNIVTLFSYLLIFAFLIFVLCYGVGLCFENYLRKYQTLTISYSFGTAAVPIGSIFMLLTLAEHFMYLIKNWGKPNVV